LPTWGVPEIVGRLVLFGAVVSVLAVTTSVSGEYAEALPALFVAVTRTLLRPPTSHATGEYVAWVYPTIGEQLLPVWSQ
jgi:hypothetical protein